MGKRLSRHQDYAITTRPETVAPARDIGHRMAGWAACARAAALGLGKVGSALSTYLGYHPDAPFTCSKAGSFSFPGRHWIKEISPRAMKIKRKYKARKRRGSLPCNSLFVGLYGYIVSRGTYYSTPCTSWQYRDTHPPCHRPTTTSTRIIQHPPGPTSPSTSSHPGPSSIRIPRAAPLLRRDIKVSPVAKFLLSSELSAVSPLLLVRVILAPAPPPLKPPLPLSHAPYNRCQTDNPREAQADINGPTLDKKLELELYS